MLNILKNSNGTSLIELDYGLGYDIGFRLKDFQVVKDNLLGNVNDKKDNSTFTYEVLQPLFKDFSTFDVNEFLYNGRNTRFIVTINLPNQKLFDKYYDEAPIHDNYYEAPVVDSISFTTFSTLPSELQSFYNKVKAELEQFLEIIMETDV